MNDALDLTTRPTQLVPALLASLNAKLQRLLARPLIAQVEAEAPAEEDAAATDAPSMLQTLRSAARSLARQRDAWMEDADDGKVTVRVSIDYERVWREREREVLETFKNAIEGSVTLLTEAQKVMLEKSPRAFLELQPRPETVELVGFEARRAGGQAHVLTLTLASAPASRTELRYIAIIPNLAAIERQLAAIGFIEKAADDGSLAPLRALVGLSHGSSLSPSKLQREQSRINDEFDESQRECIRNAITTPHFALIQGPPGSGKTKVIGEIVRHALAAGERVLVVSPTHVAVDNVVEGLVRDAGRGTDCLEPATIPVRYSARATKLSREANEYWVGPKKQHRGATIARRVEARLVAKVPIARGLFAQVDESAAGRAPISSAVARSERVVCGTPMGILSFEPVKAAEPGAYDLLIVDEVSKMTLGEFLAVAVKARRWVLVGDPEQLSPFSDAEENAETLNDLIPPILELACSVAAILQRTSPERRREARIVVASTQPELAAAVIRAQLRDVLPESSDSVAAFQPGPSTRVLVAPPNDTARAVDALTALRLRSVGAQPTPEVKVLAERGVGPLEAMRAHAVVVGPRSRAQAIIFDTACTLYVTQPWAAKSSQRLRTLSYRHGLAKCLPSAGALEALGPGEKTALTPHERRGEIVREVAIRFAVNALSVYDWLTTLGNASFDVSPLRELQQVGAQQMVDAVSPHVAKLNKQYRMHRSISQTPRALFYFGEALIDGRDDDSRECCVELVHVEHRGPELESNEGEAAAIAKILRRTNEGHSTSAKAEIMIITPYRAQEERLRREVESLEARGELRPLSVEVCTFDRCQGREADYVIISLVKDRSSAFLDVPKRWNVALTRARKGLFIVGNVGAFLNEASRARAELKWARKPGPGLMAGEARPQMSVLARIIEAYDAQIRTSPRGQSLKVGVS